MSETAAFHGPGIFRSRSFWIALLASRPCSSPASANRPRPSAIRWWAETARSTLATGSRASRRAPCGRCAVARCDVAGASAKWPGRLRRWPARRGRAGAQGTAGSEGTAGRGGDAVDADHETDRTGRLALHPGRQPRSDACRGHQRRPAGLGRFAARDRLALQTERRTDRTGEPPAGRGRWPRARRRAGRSPRNPDPCPPSWNRSPVLLPS